MAAAWGRKGQRPSCQQTPRQGGLSAELMRQLLLLSTCSLTLRGKITVAVSVCNGSVCCRAGKIVRRSPCCCPCRCGTGHSREPSSPRVMQKYHGQTHCLGPRLAGEGSLETWLSRVQYCLLSWETLRTPPACCRPKGKRAVSCAPLTCCLRFSFSSSRVATLCSSLPWPSLGRVVAGIPK